MTFKPITVLIAIYQQIVCCCSTRYYVYRFELITGDERSTDIDNTNVISYRFINQGNTVADVNGMKIVSSITISSLGIQVPGSDIDLSRSTFPNEVDTTIYKVRFEPPPPAVPANNCLLVISKCRATKRAMQMEIMGGAAGRLQKYLEKNGKPPRGHKEPVYEDG